MMAGNMDKFFISGEETLALNTSSGNEQHNIVYRPREENPQLYWMNCRRVREDPCLWQEVVSVNSPLGSWTVVNTHKQLHGSTFPGRGNGETWMVTEEECGAQRSLFLVLC